MKSYVFDMETSDPDDFFTLLFLLGHPEVDLKAVTITPGTEEQVGIVRWALRQFGREDIPVGAFDVNYPGSCVSAWHYNAFGMEPSFETAPPGWKVLYECLDEDTTLVTGGPLKNLGALLRQVLPGSRDSNFIPEPGFTFRWVAQEGFAGEGVVPPGRQLEKFKGLRTCPTYNLGGDPKSALLAFANAHFFKEILLVSKNVCHGVFYDQILHDQLGARLCLHTALCSCECHNPGVQLMHIEACCNPCPYCGERAKPRLAPSTDRKRLSQTLMWQGMEHYLKKKPGGKKFHDPLAACCAIQPDIGEWVEVEMFNERGEWGARLEPGSGVKIITGYDPKKFASTLLGELSPRPFVNVPFNVDFPVLRKWSH